jgi:hypothetical protein
MAGIPAFTADPISAAALISTANTGRDGTGTLGTIYTARSAATGGKGCRIDAVTVQATGTTTAGMVRLFVDDGTARVIREIAISALTPSGTVKGANITTTEGADVNGRLALGLILKAGDILKVSTHNAESFVVRAEGGEF